MCQIPCNPTDLAIGKFFKSPVAQPIWWLLRPVSTDLVTGATWPETTATQRISRTVWVAAVVIKATMPQRFS